MDDTKEIRESAVNIPIEILEQKLQLHQGLLMLSFNKPAEARECFIKCLNCSSLYDARIRKECVEQLQMIFRYEGITSSKLDAM